MEKNCLFCNKIFFKAINTSLKNWNNISKYCGRDCSNKSKIGKPGANLGKSFRASPATEFKKGENLNESHPLWRGEDAHIKSKHSWVKRHKGKAEQCLNCQVSSETKTIDWANIDHKYKRNLDDYISLCRSCHRKFDIANNGYSRKFN